MSMKRIFRTLAVLSIAIGAGFASLPAAQAKSLAPFEAATVPALGTRLPVVTPGSHLIQAYWRYRYRYGYHRRYYRPYYYRRHYYYRPYRHYYRPYRRYYRRRYWY
jgi:hypothetical protein